MFQLQAEHQHAAGLIDIHLLFNYTQNFVFVNTVQLKCNVTSTRKTQVSGT